ncbi:Ycf48-like protein precursor [Planctomycetes bacterium MalM25]|nr:Ycf48-like protein precursor [Planctomycetes bacterium MalM25]
MRLTATLIGLLSAAPTLLAAPGDSHRTLTDVLADEASLRDVTFADADHGWAVGDHGAILRTTDGGDRWRRLESPTHDRLDGVCFLNANRGWAVGGAVRPYTHESRGVVLGTTDGGRTWETLSSGQLPRLRCVHFFDAARGVAAGDGTAQHPSGIFTTDDGGRHWRPLPGGEPRQWLAGDFTQDRLGELAGAVAGLRGESARVAGRKVKPSLNAGDLRGGYAVAMRDAARGWLVGDGGLVRVTEDGGQAWSDPPADPPEALNDSYDWRAAAVRGDRVWIAGSPGALVLASEDGGATWSTANTGVTTPITAMTFIDDRVGWAVGEMGIVLTTRNGGRTWRTQRGGGRRAALAVLVATIDQLPTELLASVSAAEGHRTVVHAPLTPESAETAGPLSCRLADASTLVGADATRVGWSLPLTATDATLPAGLLRERLDRLTDGRSHELLVAEVQKLLAAYRPDVIAIPAGEDGPSILLAEAATEALERPLVVQHGWAGLERHPTPRLVAYRADDGSPLGAEESRLSTGDFAPLLGATPSQWRRGARGLLSADYHAAPAAHRWRTLAGRAAAGGGSDNLLAGAVTARGGDARRPAAMAGVNRLDQLRRVAGKRRNLERLLDQAQGDPAWAGQVVNLTGGLDAEAGAELLGQLAEGYRQAGRYELAANTLYLLARRYPDAPLADAALLWLVRYYASGERAHVDSRSAGVDARPNETLANMPSGANPALRLAPREVTGTLSSEERLDRAAALIDFLEQARPGLYADPATRFLQATTQRARGFGGDADKAALVLSKQSIAKPWRRAAEAERWLAKPEGLPPAKPIANCRFTPRRPLLDGRLDDATWSQATPIRLATADDPEPTASVRVAHDEAFLYVAIEAESATPETVDPKTARPRDADLADHDRVRLRIDTDRDYTTAFELTIDARGWTHDALWRDVNWKPTWYVAADTDESHWRVEAAIPLAELADPEQLARAAWAVSLERLRPGEAPAAWPAGAERADSPDAFGLLLFD